MTTPNTGKSAPSSRHDKNRTWHAAIELTEQELKRVVGGSNVKGGVKFW